MLTDKVGLSAVRKKVRGELARVGVDPSATFDCLVAVTEACTQALAHADEDATKPQISWEIDRTRALFYIRDYSSQEWSRASHPSTSLVKRPDDLDQRLEDLGLQLMRGLMDDVRIEMEGNGTTVVLVRSFASS